jgi:hypothetical protein
MARHRFRNALVLAGAVALWALPSGEAHGQQQAARHAAPAEARRKDEQAMAALKEMSDTLAGAKTMRFKIRNLVPLKASSGDWITLLGAATVMREGTNQLFVETGGDLFHFRLYYDGKTVTAFAPQEKIYAQKDAPGSIDETLTGAANRGEVAFVFADLVSSDPYAAMTKGLLSASVVGTSTVDGVETQHLAVHGKGVDWEIWIGTNDRLPRLVTITDIHDARKPTQTVQLSDWQLGGNLPADTFSFTAPEGATKVAFRNPMELSSATRRARSGKKP